MASILLAEDDPAMLNFLQKALTRAGHDVMGVENGLEALALLKDEAGAHDLLLTDIVMPGMDGIELSQKALKYAPEIKVMFITGFAAMAMASQAARNAQAQAQPSETKVLSKPFHLNQLVHQVDHLLKAA